MEKSFPRYGRFQQGPGKAVQYLLDNFSLPTDDQVGEDSQCYNGHVLLFHIQNGKKGIQTVKWVHETFGLLPTRTQVLNLEKKCTRLFSNFGSREKTRAELTMICQERFVVQPRPPVTVANPEASVHIQSETNIGENVEVSSALPPSSPILPVTCAALQSSQALAAVSEPSTSLPLSSSYTTRSSKCLTPRERKLKTRLSFVQKARAEERRTHIDRLKEMRANMIKVPYQMKLLKQTVKRKEEKVRKLKAELKMKKDQKLLKFYSAKVHSLIKQRDNLKAERKAARRAKDNHSECRRQLKEKKKIIQALENENCELKESLQQYIHPQEDAEESMINDQFVLEDFGMKV